MGTYNGTLKKWNATGEVWDELLPKTTAENIISGTLDLARIPVMDTDRIPSLPASKITSGTIDAARLPAIAITNVLTYTTYTAFSTAYAANHNLAQAGDIIIFTTPRTTYVHNGGSAHTLDDLTLLQTPTDLVTSVAGKTGTVTLVKGDVGLGNVDNTADSEKNVLSASKLTTARTIAGASFDGSANISISYANLTNKPTIPTIPSVMSVSEGSTGTATTQRTIDASNLKQIVLAHSPAGSRPASDVSAWAKAANPPSLEEMGALVESKTKLLFHSTTQYIRLAYGGMSQAFIRHAAGVEYELYHTGNLTLPSYMSVAEGATGTEVTPRTVSASNLKEIVIAHTKGYTDARQMILVDTLPTAGLVDGQMAFEY